MKRNRDYYISGIIVFLGLFLASLMMNHEFSYMGNQSDSISKIIINNFWHIVLFQLVKLLLIYLIIGITLNVIFYGALIQFQMMFNIIRKPLTNNIMNMSMLLFFALLLFSKKLIENPQLYVENWSQRSELFRKYQIFLTDSISPNIFYLLILFIFAIALFFFLLSLDWNDYFKNLFNWVKHNRGIQTVIITLGIGISFIIIYSGNVKLYNNNTERPNILIISADALRPDHLSCNGYHRKTTPHIDRLSRQSLQIRGVITTVPRTFPSWVSILTSTYPLTHEIKHMLPRSRERNAEFNTVCNDLNKLGYKTAVISDFAGDIFPRIDLGFDKVIAPDLNFSTLIKQILLERQTFLLPFVTNRIGMLLFPEMRGIARFSVPYILTEETKREIKASQGNPFFIVTFYSITHFPFAAPYPFYKKYSNPDYNGPYKYYKERIIKLSEDNKASHQNVIGEDSEQVTALYDGCFNLFDREVGKIVDFLSDKKMLDNTIIVITSDHGENLYEKDLGMGHGEHLRSNLSLEVPLIIFSNNNKIQKGERLNRLSSTIDIIPTIFDIACLNEPDYFEGVSILKKRNIIGYNEITNIDAYSETGVWFDNNKNSDLFFHHLRIDYPDISVISEIDLLHRNEIVLQQGYQNIVNASKHRTIYSGRYKLIYVPLSEGPRFELYDYIEDPYNRIDLSKTKKDQLEIMKKKFYQFVDEKSSGNYLVKEEFLLPIFTDPIF
ncbi:MAG: sulfatase-like hydrolase/transferase [Spirochaetota bacterium]|nr:sulfatase-like hydrolase/transferase [Spirochaetota bacterium]